MPKFKHLLENQVVYDGKVFTKDKKTGYYLSAQPINGKRVRLHRYIFVKFNGEIPKGADVHHKDEDKDNNDISNLRLMTSSKHTSLHSNERIYNNYEEERQKFLDRTQEKAKEWHKSAEGYEWHREHAKTSIIKAATDKTEDAICLVCGTHYKTTRASAGKAMFCSKKCKAKYRRDMHLDDVLKKCAVCGDEFFSSKYDKVQTCSSECKVKLFKKSRTGKEW